jgi:hypothetical protein
MKICDLLYVARPSIAALLFASLLTLPSAAQSTSAPQTPTPPPPASAIPAPAQKDAQPVDEGDNAPISSSVDRSHRTVAQNITEAWTVLKNAATDEKKPDDRVQAVAAISTLQASPLAHKLVSDALNNSSIDIRTAAIIAVGTLKDTGLEGKVRQMLDDKEPQIAFIAATTLWKMGDKSGEDILMAVTAGDRKTDPGLIKSSERTAGKDLRSPTKLAEIGARQGAGYFLGPFGYGITVWDYTHQHPGVNPRVVALTLLAQSQTANVHAALVGALTDKDPQVRAAAARALGDYRTKATGDSLLIAFDDPKLPVRLLSAAAYIRINSAAPLRRPTAKK